ncbi:MAG: septum formation initiator family protein [Desulfosalsimonadaceae bacterium]|nr:septum formation initiator family protein [Desulfosalsimonadaceae bacterium]
MKLYQSIIAFIIASMLIVAYFFLVIRGDKGWNELNAMKLEVNTLKAQNEALSKKNTELQQKVNRLKNDPAFLEDIARQELKVIAKDEIVFKFKKEEAAGHE